MQREWVASKIVWMKTIIKPNSLLTTIVSATIWFHHFVNTYTYDVEGFQRDIPYDQINVIKIIIASPARRGLNVSLWVVCICMYMYISTPWIWKSISATLESGRYTLSYRWGRYINVYAYVYTIIRFQRRDLLLHKLCRNVNEIITRWTQLAILF